MWKIFKKKTLYKFKHMSSGLVERTHRTDGIKCTTLRRPFKWESYTDNLENVMLVLHINSRKKNKKKIAEKPKISCKQIIELL